MTNSVWLMQLVEPRPSRPIPIRMTPLIDVVFILLVFFMLTSRLLPVGYIELGNNTGKKTTAMGEPLPTLTITDSDMVLWQGNTLSPDDLLEKLIASGVSEVNLTTLPETGLGQFTLVLSLLDEHGIKTHWQRAVLKTP